MMLKLLYFRWVLVTCLCTGATVVMAQDERSLISKGNSLYKEKNYAGAELAYRKAVEKKNTSVAGSYNLGDALYKQGKFDEAATKFQQATTTKADESTIAKTYHNLGNALLKSKKLEESIEAYKTSLKKNPQDKETKYNLSFAQAMLKKQQEQQNKDKNKENKENQKEDKDKKDKAENKNDPSKDKGKEESENKQENSKDSKKEESEDQSQKQPNKPKKGEMSEQEAQRILDALNQQEFNVQKKLNKKDAQVLEIEKNW